MSRRSFFVALSLVMLFVGGAGFALFFVVGYEPAIYSRALPPSEEVRLQRSQEFLTEFFHLYDNASSGDRDWDSQFTDEQFNSYLDEGFIRQGLASRVLPDGVSRPHVVFDQDKIHLAFRYGAGTWNTVISIDLRVWLAKAEPNAVALELEGIRAGALPISGQWLQEEFAKVGRENNSNVEITWYRREGHPVALVRFQADQPHPTLLLQTIQLRQGALFIRGRSPEGAPTLHTLLNLPDGPMKPVAD